MTAVFRAALAWWRDKEWRSIRRWFGLAVCALFACAAVVAALGTLARSFAPPQVTDDASTPAHALDPLIAQVAAQQMPPHWDWRLLKAMVRKESNYKPDARSPGGAVGLTQMLPQTARHMGLNRRQFFDPQANLSAGTRYLRSIYDRFHAVPDKAPHWHRTRLAIAGYNAGPGRVRRAMKKAGSYRWQHMSQYLPDSTQHHVERIVDDFYPRYSDLSQSPGRPRIGRWKSSLRFWGDS